MKTNNRQYPAWIDDFAKSAYQLIGGNVLESYQPLDFYHFNPLWYDLLLQKLKKLKDRLQAQGKNLANLDSLLPSPSFIRSILIRVVAALPYLDKSYHSLGQEIIKFLVEILQLQMQEDVFAFNKNHKHTGKEVREIVLHHKFLSANTQQAKKLAIINMAAGHLVNGLYNDVNTDYGWDVFGPYDVSQYFGPGHEMIMREFPDLKPDSLWSNLHHHQIKSLRLVAVYENAGPSIHYVGCHTDFQAAPAEKLRWFAIKGVTKGRVNLSEHLLALSVGHYQRVKRMNLEELKIKVQEQDLYPFQDLFSCVGMDWRPSQKKKDRVQGKPLRKDLFTYDKLVSYEEFCQEYGINFLKQLYQK